ncbi:potassium channel subfamily K member 18 [Parasteatoda tepidariorum]|uniref:potassium channel subfamily K member 18 n=1 Tax=Parasteatoda tepidariorum TaxID=114398 RepID=UPI00077FC8F1|nr:TWiK family of potassium channels protein 7 [Parasteatoda tepidariorum]
MCHDCISKCTKCRKYCRLVTTFLFSHIGLCGLIVGYSLIGAFTFEALEAKYEQVKREIVFLERNNTINDLWSITAKSIVLSEKNWSSLATEILQDFEITIVRAVKKDGYDGKDESPLQWTFSGALLYSIIVITTIGYGNVAPKTSWGKVVTIFYAIIGIPLLLLCLSNIGDSMAHSFKFIYWKLCCYFCIRPKKRRKKTSNRPLHISYSAPIIHQESTNGISMQPGCVYPGDRDSPALTSSGTYYTAHSNSNPTISSCKSTPCHLNHARMDSKNDKTYDGFPSMVNSYDACSPHMRNVEFAPVITNKYALQEDVHINSEPLRKHKELLSSVPALLTVMSSSYYKNFGYGINKSAPTKDRVSWKEELHNKEYNDNDSMNSLSTQLEDEEVTVPVWLCFALVLSYICGGAVLFTFWEKWNFLDSSYFCFVTLTTIGFGDLVPGTAVLSDDNQLTLGLCSLYLLFGMALLAMSFNLVQEEVTRSMRCMGQRIGIIPMDEDDD